MSTSVWIDSMPDIRRFEPLKGDARAEIVVIGGGITGVMAAYEAAKSGADVILVEKNHIGTGDSSATTGFMTRVPDVSLTATAAAYGVAFLKDLFHATGTMQKSLMQLIKSHQIECDLVQCDSYYSSYADQDSVLASEWEIAAQVGGGASFVGKSHDELRPFEQAIRYESEGQFHVRKFLFSLLKSADQKKLRVYEETEVLSIDVGADIVLKTTGGTITAKKIIVAVGSPAGLLPELTALIDPKISYVIAARFEEAPIARDLFWDTLDPYFYYRMIDDHTLIVGGCDIAFDKIATQKPYEKLEAFVREHFKGDHAVTHRWSGSIFHTADGLPYVFEHPHYKGKVFVGTGFGGNGLVCGSLAGTILAGFATKGAHEFGHLFSFAHTDIVIPQPIKRMAAGEGVKKFQKVADLAEFAAGKPLCKTVEGQKIVLFKVGDEYFAMDNTCSHAGGSLAEGIVEGKTIECPLHGAKFDVTTGEVKGLPATRSIQKYAVRVVGTTLEVEMMVGGRPAAGVKSAPKKPTYWKMLGVFSLIAFAFFALEFALQYFWLSKGNLDSSLIRASSLSGATLIGLALFSSAIFKWSPRLAMHWRIRRYLGVGGFVCIVVHVLSVYNYIYQWDVLAAYYSLNPLKNPLVFGSIGFFILFAMSATSTDWAVDKLGYKTWKFIHRFVYVAYIASIFHFLLINPVIIKNPPGYFLIAVTAAALFGQIFWYVKTVAKRGVKSWGTWIGAALIVGTFLLGWAAVQ